MKSFLLTIGLLSLLFANLAYGQSEPLLTLNTSKTTYEEGETITISGKVSAIIIGTPVTLQVFHEGNLVEIAQLEVAQDGTFAHTILAEGPQWKIDGEYIIRASYGQGNVAEVSFEFFTSKAEVITSEIFEADAGSSGTFDVKYTIRGGTVENMLVDSDIFAIIVIINSESDGSITLELPREFIDAKKSDGTDDTYIILIDGMEVPYEEISSNANSRTIKINFEEGDSDIEIIGTFAIPEFGILAIIVLLFSMVGIVLMRNVRIMKVN